MTFWKLQEQGLREVFLGSLVISLTEQSYISQGEYSLWWRERGWPFLRLSLP